MTTISIPPWFSDLILFALCTGLLLGLEHEISWPGKNVEKELPVWLTQIIGVATLWIGFTAFFVLTLHTWGPPLILAVFVFFGGLFPLSLRLWRFLKEKFHLLKFLEKRQGDA